MLIVISPAKTLDLEAGSGPAMTDPVFAQDALRLAKRARQLSLAELKRLMGLSDALGRLNRERFRAFETTPKAEALTPAALTFAGDTYQGLWARDFSDDEWAVAQRRLRILSGLYGLLRPLDGIQPYRLEMGAKLQNRRGRNLYSYWGDQIAQHLNAEADALGTDILLNCASQEYFRAVDRVSLKLRVITPVFLEEREDGDKVISFFAKRARGAMARFAITGGVSRPEHLLEFEGLGYRYRPDLSEEDAPVFSRSSEPG
ncbi:peroxide stress protein YaaA [Aestuariibius sp. 2305UL40-4]|uniref:peroxide stress protein YaaA n=1 Tax=Aestuariibius violaceus TaxID=3234132 RepID=UPI00345F0A8D